jgi:replication-associated recombination protein RarA
MNHNVNIDGSQWKQRTLKPLVSEILRPQVLSDLILPIQTIQRLQRMLESGARVNMLFYGPPGSGKTSAARIFMNAIGGGLIIDRSFDTSPNLAKLIENYVIHAGADKICFVDEAHFFSKREQTPLPELIDRLSRPALCRLLFAATDITKLTPQAQSRLTKFSFEIPRENREAVQKRMMERCENLLSAAGYTFDKVRLEQIIQAHFPDLRSIANNIEFEFA